MGGCRQLNVLRDSSLETKCQKKLSVLFKEMGALEEIGTFIGFNKEFSYNSSIRKNEAENIYDLAYHTFNTNNFIPDPRALEELQSRYLESTGQICFQDIGAWVECTARTVKMEPHIKACETPLYILLCFYYYLDAIIDDLEEMEHQRKSALNYWYEEALCNNAEETGEIWDNDRYDS